MKIGLLGCLALTVSSAFGSTLSMNTTVDNGFSIYISTSSSVLGTLVGTGNDWQTTYSFSTALTPGVTNYLQVVANNIDGPGAFLGDFSLDDTNFHFVNNTQTLLTNNVDWFFSTTAIGGPYTVANDQGANGVGPWGTRPGIDSNAHWIGDPGNCTNCTVYFETAITPNAATPEPTTPLLIAGGVALLLGIRRKKRSNIV